MSKPEWGAVHPKIKAAIEAEPEHPPCTEPSHLVAGECGIARCGTCDESYSLGQKIQRGSFHWWPDGEYAYWAHTRDSEKHQLILDIGALNQHALLTRIDGEWTELRIMSKQYKSPERRRLRLALT